MVKTRRGGLRSSWVHRLVGFPSVLAVTFSPLAPAYADVVAATDGLGNQITATTITPGVDTTFTTAGGSVTETGTLVTTSTIRGGVGFNAFSEFNVGAGTNVHVVQPDGTSALVNIVDGSGASQIDGQVSFLRDNAGNNTTSGSNIFFVNSDGFVVGASGVINAGQLTMSTPAASHVANLLAEAQGTATGHTATLFSGDEELNSSANIEIYGTINAERLDLRAGARMVLNGTITVEDASGSGTIAPAVSTEGIEEASGVSVENGVIRLFAGSEISAGATSRTTARRGGGAGGLIQGASGGAMTIAGGAEFDVAGTGSGDGGSVILYGKNSAALAAGTVIDASATAGSGGFATIQSGGSVTVAGEIVTGSDTNAAGAVVLKGTTVSVNGSLTTAGGDIAVLADDSITVTGGINTRHVAVGGDATTGDSIAASGDLLLFAPKIDVQSGASLRADGNAGSDGGLVGLIAYDRTTGVLWTFEGDDRAAEIDVDGATLHGGAVLINAYAEATNVFGDDADSLTEFSTDFENNQSFFEDYLDTIADTVESVLDRGPDLVNDLLIPLQVYDVSADADITINNSTIVGDGNWKNENIDPTAGYTGDIAENGINMQSGLALAQYDLFTGQPIEVTGTLLPQDWDPTVDSVYIHSHAATEVDISPLTVILAVGIAITDVDSHVTITDTDITSNVGDVALRSTASETNGISLASWPVAGLAGGLIISARDLDNQLLVDGGSIDAANDLDARALTGITQTFSNIADAYQDGWYAAAITINVSSAFTEAAIGGDIDTGGDVQLDAETLVFDRTSITNANMGLAPILTTAVWNHTLGPALEKFKNKVQGSSQGDKASEEDKKPGSAGGFALDVQIEDTDTYASLGGSFHDFGNAGAVTALTTTDILAAGSVNVNADMRFASVAEGGVGIYRSIIAAMGSLDFMTKKHAAALGVSQEDLTGSYGKAKFVNIGVGWLEGDTIAEIGSDVTLSAVDLNVNAVTSWPSVTPLQGIKLGWDAFAQDVADFEVPAIASDGSITTDEFEAPDILTYLDPYTYVTTETKAKAIAPVAKDVKSEQEQAIAVSLNFFSTQNKTEAAIRSGADVTLSGDLALKALEEGLFVHVSNLPIKNPLGSAKTEDSVGGTAVVARTAADVSAVIEANVTVDATGDVDVEAINDVIAINQTFASASAKGSSVNAAVSATIIEADTTARIDDSAIIIADEVTISAEDTSILWSMAGALSKGQDKGVGASGAVNFVTRNISAGIGRSGAPLASVDGTTTITANSLTIDATNDGLEVAATIAGSNVHGKADDDDAENEEATMTPNAMLSFEEYFAISQQNRVETYPDETGEPKETGWSIAGSASLNLILGNSLEAELETFGTVDLTGDLSVTATSTELGIAVAGSAATAKNDDPDDKTNALAGALALTVGMRDVTARITAADIDAAGVTLAATDSAMTIGVAAGGSKSSNADKTLAGSAVVNWLTGETRAEADDIEVDATGDVVVEATDESVTAAGAGALSMNASKTQGYGLGVGVAANTVDRATTARITGVSDIAAANLSVLAMTTAEIYGIGFSYGAGRTGFAGSVAVNTWTGGAQALIEGTSSDRIAIEAGTLTVDAEETVTVWNLAGAVTRGSNTAVGGAFAVNTVVGETEARADYVTLDGPGDDDFGAITIDADATSDIGVLAVAGAKASDETGVGVGVAVNTITGGTTAGLSNTNLDAGTSADVTADSDRTILSLGGGVTQAGRGGAGFALTTNLIVANDTHVDLDGSDLTLSGDLTARAENDGTIGSLAVGISLSKDTSLGGGVTVNVATGETIVSMDGTTIDAASVELEADDGTVINSLSGAAARSSTGTGVGGAISANVIVHDTAVEIANSQITTGTTAGNGLTATATNTGEINTLAAALSQSSGGAAYAGSIAVGDIGNSARVEMAGGSFTGGDLTLEATKTTEIDILSGAAAAGSGGSAFGAGVTVALIHGATTADLLTPGATTGGTLTVTATNDQDIDAIAVSGSYSGSAPAGSGAIVYSQIGTAPSGGPSVDPMNKNDGDEDTVASGQAETEGARDDAFTQVSTLSGQSINATLDQGDVTRARVELASDAPDFDAIAITADETSSIDSLAGVLSGSSSSSFGGSIAVNLVFGDTEAELIVPDTADLTVDGDVSVTANQDGTITTMAAAGAGGSSTSGTGSIVVNVMNREALARIATASGTAALYTTGGNVTVGATQTGTIRSIAGAAAVGGSNGIGGAVAVTVQSDDVYAAIDGVSVTDQNAVANQEFATIERGTIDVAANSDLEVETYAVAAGAGGSGAFGGSVSVTVADGTTEALVRNAQLYGTDVNITADATLDLAGTAGGVAASGSNAAGIGVVTNIAALDVDATVDAASVYAAGDFILQADADTDLSGIAVGGALSGSVSVAGSAVANTSSNTVDATLSNEAEAIARDSAMMAATATTAIGLGGGAEEHSLDLSFAGGGSLGVAASVAANLSENTAQATVTDGSIIAGAGEGTVTDIYGDTRRGTIVDAMASTSVNMIGVTAGAGGTAGIAAGFGYATADDTARVQIGEGTTTTAGIVGGGLPDDVFARIDSPAQPGASGGIEVDTGQDAYLRSRVDTDISTIGAAVGLGGTVGVGAASTVVNVTSDAETLAEAASIGGANDVVMDATNTTDVETIVVGAGGGYVGAAASAGVTLVNANALTRASGASILAGTGDLSITANNAMDTSHLVGGLSGGFVGAAGAIGVTVAGGSAIVEIETADGAYDFDENLAAISRADAGGTLTVAANTDIETDVTAVSGSGGAFAIALSGNVTLVESTTQVSIDAGQRLISDGNMSLTAEETVDIDGIAGSFGAGALGVGASLDYASFSGLTDVTIGSGTIVTSGGTLGIAATSERDIDSTVVVGTVAGAGFAAAVSVIEAGGTTDDGDRDDQLSNVQTELSGSNDGTDGSDTSGSVDDLGVYSGGSSIQDDANSARQNVNVTAASTDAASINIGNSAILSSGGAMSIDVTGDTAAAQLAGALSISLAGASSGTAVADISNDAILNIGNDVQLNSGGNIALSTTTGNGTGDAVFSQAATVAGSLSYAAGVGVAVANSDSQSQIAIGSNLDADAASGNITMQADRTDVVRADVFNVSVGATLGAGVAVATATNEGDAGVTIAGGSNAEMVAAQIEIEAADTSAAIATATGSSGGILAGLNGVVVSASNTAGVTTSIGQTEMRALGIDINATAASRASATATGIAAGLAGVGASVATATTDVTVSTTVTNIDAEADEVTIAARYDDANGQNARARATSSSGGAIAGNGAEATAQLDYDVTTDVSGDIDATGSIAIMATADDASAFAEGSGQVGGLAAAGAVLATAEHLNTSTVATYVRAGTLTSDDLLTITASNAPSLEAVTESGSGGVISGSYSLAEVDGDAETLVDLGAGGSLLLSALDVRIGATGDATLASELDNLSAAAVGFSGARSETDFDTDVDTTIRGTVDILGYDIALSAANNVTRAEDGFNIKSGSGGLLDVAAVQSFVTVNADTDLALMSGASVTGVGDPDAPGDVLFAVTTDLDLTDRVSLDAGGAIAVPVGESTVEVAANTADLTIGNVDIFTVGDLELVTGGDTYLKAESNANSYGLAGAATANTEATYNGDHVITIGSGAVLESLGDIAIKAGHTTTGIQNVEVYAESRVFNKTAIPIPTDPAADALADTRSSVNIQSGAEILAVTDVYLYAEGGGRTVSGYGRGKDLYREVAAAIANALGSLVGADDVSLDIESGSSTDRADNGITVNGAVRAGSRNEQILRLNTSYGIANAVGENYDGMNWTIAYDQSLASELQARIDELNGYINNSTLSQNQPAVDAWRAERDLLISRQAAAGSTLIDVVTVDPVYVSEGNITLRADYVVGGASGELNAPGDAEITIESFGEALLKIDGAFISEDEGGKITLNDVRVRSTADIAAQNEGGGSVNFGFVDGESSNEPVIFIKAYGRDTSDVAQPGMGSISIAGDIANPRGLVQIETAMGDLDITGDISGKSLDLKATNGNLVLGYIPGFREVGGTPEDQYASYFSLVEDKWRNAIRLGATIDTNALNGTSGFSIKTASTGLTAGRNIFISADTVNINGPITAGRSYYQSDIEANVTADIAALGAGTGTQVIYDPAGWTPGAYQSSNISGDVRVSYNHDTGRLELDPVVVEGGTVEIFGDIISTGPGSIQALDGFGEIRITSDTTVPLTVNRLSLGSGEGVEGLVRITDTGQLDGSGNPLVTEFRRDNGQTLVFNSLTSITETDPDTGLSITRPSNPVSSSSDRTATYDVRDNRDYVVLQAEEVVRNWYKKEEVEVIIGVFKTKKKSTTSTIDINQNEIDLGFGPYVDDSGELGSADYGFTGWQLSETTVETVAERKTHDSVKWYKLGSGWQHFRTDYATTTVHLYEHRVRADYDVAVSFAGSDQGRLNIQAVGDVYFADTVEATFGTTSITSTNGSLLTAGKQVEISTANLGLSAVNGSITGIDGAFRVDQVDGAQLTATARDAVNIREMDGNMNVVAVTATGRSTTGASTGNVTLYAQDTITQVSGGAGISGMNIDVTAEEGGLGSSTQNFIIDTDGGTLTAQARGDIFIAEASGDLGINTVTSDFGSVTLTSPGRITDRNDIETTDVRKQSELEELWFNDLQLANTASREAEQIAALEAERTHAYLMYWQERDAAGGATLTYAMDATTEASLRAAGWTDDMLAAYVADREALYATWNAEAAYDPNYTYTASVAEQSDILDGIGWTASELTRSIRAGLVRQTGDTVIRVEDPNVSAFGDITLNAATGIGELTETYVIAAGTNLSDADLEKLAAAEKDDITVTADGSIEVRQLEDLDFAFTDTTNGVANGRLTMITTTNEIYSGAETAATLDTIQGTGDVQLRIDGEMRDAMTGSWAIQGSAIVLEAGDFASIGTEAEPVRLDILAGGAITARAGVDVNLSAIGAMPIDQVFAGETARLNSAGAMTDNVASGLPRVVADDIVLSAATIGTTTTPLVVTQNAADGSISLTTTTGDMNVDTSGNATFTNIASAAGGVLNVAGDMALQGNNVISFATGETLDVTATGGFDTSAATGTMAQGGTLDLTISSGLGSAAQDFATALEGLIFTTTGTGATPVYLSNTGNLVLDIDRSNDAGSVVDVTVVGTLDATIDGTADIDLTATEITAATLSGDVVTLVGTNGVGTTTPVALTANRLAANASNGGIAIALTGDTVMDALTAGAGAISVTGAASAVDLAAAINATGNIGFDVASLTGDAPVTSTGGAISMLASGGIAFTTGANMTTSGGDIGLTAGGDLAWAGSTGTTNGGALALSSGGAMALTTLDLTTAGGAASITAGNGLTATGTTLDSSGGNIDLNVTGDAQWTGGYIAAGNGTLGLTVAGNATVANTAFSTDGTAMTIGVTGTLDADDTTLATAGGAVALTVGNGDLDTVGVTTSGGAANINVTTSLAVADLAVATAGGTLDLTTGGAFTADGIDLTSGVGIMTLALGSGQFEDATLATDGSGMTIGAAGALSFAATSNLTTSGGDLALSSGGAMSLSDTTAVTSGGAFALTAGGALTTNRFDLDTEDGSIAIASGNANLTATTLDSGANTASLTATGTLTTDTLTVTTDAADIAVNATGAVDMAATEIGSTGGNIVLGFGATTDIDGSTVRTAGGTLDLTSDGTFAINGSTFASQTGALTITGNANGAFTGGTQINTTSGAVSVDVAGALTMDTSSATTTGANIDFALGSLAMTGGTIASAGGDMTLGTSGNASFNGATLTTGGGAFNGTVGGTLAMTNTSLASATGDVALDVGGNATLTAASISTGGGAFAGTVGGNMTMSSTASINAGTGTFALDVTGDAELAGISTGNATDDALRLTVGGTLTAANAGAVVLTANADGALTTLRLGASADIGPDGFRTQVARLDAEIANGDVHFNEADSLSLERLVATDGSVDILTGGTMIVGDVRADGAGATATVSSQGDLLADAATITGDAINLFAFGGALGGDTGTHFTADTEAGASLRLYAENDLSYSESNGDITLDFALSNSGSLNLDLAGGVTAGVLGTPNDLTIIADGDIDIQRIGGATVDLADEVALSLISPSLYGTRTARSPRTLTLEARPDGSSLYLGFGNALDQVTLRADNVDAKLYDATPDDGIAMILTDGAGGIAETVDVDFVGDGSNTASTNPWADPRPALASRSWATGVVTLTEARAASGEITTVGPLLTGETVQVGGDVWFRQRTFDMLAGNTYVGLDTDADAQIYAVNNVGTFGFTMLDEFALQIDNALVVNRKQGGVSLDGGQGFGLAVGVETGILSGNLFFDGKMGTTDDVDEDEDDWLIELDEDSGRETVRIPLIVAEL